MPASTEDWKPILARILGLDASIFTERYELKAEIEVKAALLAKAQQDADGRESDPAKVDALIQLRRGGSLSDASPTGWEFDSLKASMPLKPLAVCYRTISFCTPQYLLIVTEGPACRLSTRSPNVGTRSGLPIMTRFRIHP